MSNKYTSAYVIFTSPLWALACLGLAACHRQPLPAPHPTPVIAVRVARAPDGGDGHALAFPVEAAPRFSTPLSFRVAGQVVERRVHLGDAVRAGRILARLDGADAARQAIAARAALDAARHRLTFARQQLERDRAQFDQALISASALEQTQDAASAAEAGAVQAEQQAAVSERALRYHTLVADHDGFISSETAEVGQNVAAGQAVYGLAWSGTIDVTLDAGAADLGRVAVGQTARVTFTALPERWFKAAVREVAPDADPQTRTYRVKMTLMQEAAGVRFGMPGEAVLDADAGAGRPDAAALQIPASAIFHSGNAPAVWVIRPAESTLDLRPITIGSYSERTAVVTRGLAAGEQIVVAGVHTVFAGERVASVQPLFADEPALPGVP